MSKPVPAVLSIAGSDSGGGAGMQADLKAFAACGVHGMTAITALTAQNTVEVTSVHPVPRDFILEQVAAVHHDIGVDAVKIGMLGTAEVVQAVSDALDLLPERTPVVLDPVMVAESGAVLLDDEARQELLMRLVPRATVITPNLAEARVLAATGGVTGGSCPVERPETAEPEALARALHCLGPAHVVITGGHRAEATDLFFDGGRLTPIPGQRHPDGAAHGSGCTHSSALAAHLALGYEPLEAARAAKRIAAQAVRNGLRGLGQGAGPVDALNVAANTRIRPDPRPGAAIPLS